MRHGTIVEITPDGRPALRLVIIDDELEKRRQDETSETIIISYDEKNPYVVEENIISWDV
jgi:antitoxin (DNA-binding transcriptional repressor) of toxin-antitoxin stability system